MYLIFYLPSMPTWSAISNYIKFIFFAFLSLPYCPFKYYRNYIFVEKGGRESMGRTGVTFLARRSTVKCWVPFETLLCKTFPPTFSILQCSLSLRLQIYLCSMAWRTGPPRDTCVNYASWPSKYNQLDRQHPFVWI